MLKEGESFIYYYRCRSSNTNIEHEFKLVTDLDDLERRYIWTVYMNNDKQESHDIGIVDYILCEFWNHPFELVHYVGNDWGYTTNDK